MTPRPRLLLLAMLFAAAALLFAAGEASAQQSASAPLARFAPGAPEESLLALRVDAKGVVVRAEESSEAGSPAFALIGWAGSFDVDETKLSLAIEEGGEIVANSTRVSTTFDAEGRVAEFQLSAIARLVAGDASSDRPIQAKARVDILTLRMERHPVAAYMEEGSLKLDELGDTAVYEFNVVYDASASVAASRCVLNRESVASDGSYRLDGEFKPFADEFKAGERKTYPVIVQMKGASPADRRGVYRSATVAYDLFDRPFLIEYAVQLSPELVAAN